MVENLEKLSCFGLVEWLTRIWVKLAANFYSTAIQLWWVLVLNSQGLLRVGRRWPWAVAMDTYLTQIIFIFICWLGLMVIVLHSVTLEGIFLLLNSGRKSYFTEYRQFERHYNPIRCSCTNNFCLFLIYNVLSRNSVKPYQSISIFSIMLLFHFG